MRIWQAVKMGYVVFRAVWGFLRELDAKGTSRLSRANAKHDRRRTQLLVMSWIDNTDSGLRKWVKVDDALGPYLADYLDSELLNAYLAGSTLERQKARQAILDGANGIVETHGNHP